ncbi:PREDICTED: uncharacterized protein LOC109232982 isoform X1 [Nicotiana attenuata]|uniref:SMP-LTD domain-containing protein n=1 Tax=Nicotiana attenuata TaxID=49451 RepID=A0A1J6IF43_NICAT|nr:PREDICTED: uncharacterized protein LOC109232982 isoform X1 [Nicotiana attenuata]OIS97562.1 hypothetical protein A4A49_08070 [Nicotiana attenuata]
MLLLFIVFVLGAVTVLAVEAVGVVLLIRWLNRKVAREVDKAKPDGSLSSLEDFDFSLHQKQGIVWILESERIPKAFPVDKTLKQQKAKKEILEVTPTQKFAQIKDHYLVLTESDGSHVEILLKGCIIAAVSASSLSSRKWAKRYPIKIESRASTLYEGSRILYIYLETCWEKEAWCKSLRLASCEDKEKLKWFAKLNIEFQNYLMSLNAGYPSFMKPHSSIGVDLGDKSSKFDGSSSKVRQFLKKLGKKASKSAPENKGTFISTSDHEERKISERVHSFQDLAFAGGGVKSAPTRKPLDFSTKDVVVPSTGSGSRSQISVTSDADSDDRVFGDEGTLCWNLLISRLFFDAKRNDQMRTSLQARIQRTLSDIRIPSYIGEVTCTAVNIGNLPPYIRAMRVLPSDMNEFWAFEIDLQYSGGAILDVETRVAVQDLDFPEGDESDVDSAASHDAKPDLLEGFEQCGKGKHSEENVNKIDQTNEGEFSDGMRSSNIIPSESPQVSRWKSIFNSVAKQVSQVSLSLGIRVASIQGTMRLYIKPPPSDQIWFGFTSMPDIDFHLDSFVGEHKISSAHLSSFLINRFKVAIRETLVLPNCESVCIPCMLAEKDDWVPRQVAPFIWINRETAGNNANRQEAPSSQPGDATRFTEVDRGGTSGNAESKSENPGRTGWANQQSKSLDPQALLSVPTLSPDTGSTTSNAEGKQEKPRKVGWSALQSKSLDPRASLSVPIAQPSTSNQDSEELKAPLMKHEEQQVGHLRSTEENIECKSPSRQLVLLEEKNQITGEDDTKSTRIGRRARMLGLGKKMGEKLEERARHIEEKGRNLVERMRGQQ